MKVNSKGNKVFDKKVLEETKKENKESVNNSNDVVSIEIIELLKEQINTLNKQLEIKDNQIISLQQALNNNQELLGNQQKLFLLDKPNNNIDNKEKIIEVAPKKRSFFDFFRRKDVEE